MCFGPSGSSQVPCYAQGGHVGLPKSEGQQPDTPARPPLKWGCFLGFCGVGPKFRGTATYKVPSFEPCCPSCISRWQQGRKLHFVPRGTWSRLLALWSTGLFTWLIHDCSDPLWQGQLADVLPEASWERTLCFLWPFDADIPHRWVALCS